MPTTIVPYNALDWSGVHVPKFRGADRAWKFLKKHGFRRLPARSELAFLDDLNKAIDYANRIRSRLPEIFEVEIKKDPAVTWKYISEVILERCEEFEETLSKSPAHLVLYAKDILRGHLPEHLEVCLAGDPHSCFEYSWQILDGRLPEILHNFMFCANMDSSVGRKYRGYKSKLSGYEEFAPDYSSPQIYFEFIKYQRKNLHRQIVHYQKIYGIDKTKSVAEFLHELEYGR